MEVKITQPLLPLRDIVVFPSMVIPLFVEEINQLLLNEVMKGNKKIILTTQKNSEVDDPKKKISFLMVVRVTFYNYLNYLMEQ